MPIHVPNFNPDLRARIIEITKYKLKPSPKGYTDEQQRIMFRVIEYNPSPEWAFIEAAVIKRDGGVCRVCSIPAKTVHHNRYTYGALTGRDDHELFTLCDECHSDVHNQLMDGKKIPRKPQEFRARLLHLLEMRREMSVHVAAE